MKHLSDDDLRACALSMVYAKRHAHICGVEEEAVKLARRWGAEETHARRAGILSGKAPSCSIPRREPLWHGIFTVKRMRSTGPSTGTPPAGRT